MIAKKTEREGKGRALALGVLLAALMAAAMLLAAKPAHAQSIFTVTNTNDSGQGSLRQAILDANTNAATADTINFNIPGAGPHTISPASELPTMTGPVTIDGYSQPGSKPNTATVGNNAVLKIELNGANAGPSNGLTIEAANSVVKGLAINRFLVRTGVLVQGGTGSKVEGNFIGTDASGTQAPGNGNGGVSILEAPNNTVGGTTAAARNVISGNGTGVFIYGAGAGGNQVMGNYVGTDASGIQDLGNDGSGVSINSAPNTTVGGTTAGARNVISGNELFGVDIGNSGAGGNKVTGNYIGTDVSGTQDLGNSFFGARIIGAPNNTIGGTTAGARNTISGNDQSGVDIEGPGAVGNKVTGNYVGTDASGRRELGNSFYGVYSSAPNNTIGGTTAGERNVISSNGEAGVYIRSAGAGGNKVTGNYIGIDAPGTKELGNSLCGVNIEGAPNNTIGGTTAGARNTISGNGQNGVRIFDTGAVGNKVTGNYVGTDASGTQDLGNTFYGVYINGAPNNTIGGTTAGARNVISRNGDGVYISGANATGNGVLSNSIFANDGLGIDLGGDGPTANDPGDADSGPNELQNKPKILSAKTVGGNTTTVQTKLSSKPNTTFVLQFFSSPSGDGGKTFRGQKSVTTDANGNASFTFSPTAKVEVGRRMTATTTDPSGNTSEFSAPKTVVTQ